MGELFAHFERKNWIFLDKIQNVCFVVETLKNVDFSKRKLPPF